MRIPLLRAQTASVACLLHLAKGPETWAGGGRMQRNMWQALRRHVRREEPQMLWSLAGLPRLAIGRPGALKRMQLKGHAIAGRQTRCAACSHPDRRKYVLGVRLGPDGCAHMRSGGGSDQNAIFLLRWQHKCLGRVSILGLCTPQGSMARFLPHRRSDPTAPCDDTTLQA